MQKRIISSVITMVLILTMIFPMIGNAAPTEWDVKVSETDYYAELNESRAFFLGNQKSVGTKVGTEYYMTYTVESAKAEKWVQNGIIGTSNLDSVYAYLKTEDGRGGLYNYNSGNSLFVEGRTYFLKFTITEEGYDYTVGWAKDNRSNYLEFGKVEKQVTSNLGYFGIFSDDHKITGKLTKIRIYDKYGNDLGVRVTAGRNVDVFREKPYEKDTKVPYKYTVVSEKGNLIAISNQKVPTGNKVYMEYTVESADSRLKEAGVIHSKAPHLVYPDLQGMKKYNYDWNDKMGNGELLEVGAEYLIIFEKDKNELYVTVQKTKDGVTSYVNFKGKSGTYDQTADYYCLWLSANSNTLNFVLKDFKCYDSNKNNLGVQANKKDLMIRMSDGSWTDYTGCEAMYVCKEDQSIYALYADQTLKYTVDGQTYTGTYKIKNGVIEITVDNQTSSYEYLYHYFKNADGKQYDRLRTYKAVFDSKEGSKVETQVLNAANGYMVMKPNDPTKTGATFAGWFTQDNKEYEFGSLQTESITLYAKWDGEAYTEQADAENNKNNNLSPYVAIGAGIVILAAVVTTGILLAQRRKKNGN